MEFEHTASLAIKAINKSLENKDFISRINLLTKSIIEADKNKKLSVFFGNGGSAADAQHWAAELVCTYKNNDRRPYKALALNTDTSIITAWGNDRSFDNIFERQIEALSNTIGIAVGLSTSGKSINILKGLKMAHSKGINTFLISGEKSTPKDFVNCLIQIPASDTATIQTITQVIYHSICQKLEKT